MRLLLLGALHCLLARCSASFKIRTAQPHDGGFCALSGGHFPLPPPEPHIPWIWDATVSRSGRLVETTAISRNACRFDRKLWRKIVDAYPQYAHQLGFGRISNILAPVIPGYDYVRVNPKGYKGERKRGLQQRTVVCVFLLRGEVVARVSSLRILDVEIAELSSLQIRCPIPDHLLQQRQAMAAAVGGNGGGGEDGGSGNKKISSLATWDMMRIERRLSPRPEHMESHLPNSTESFPVCNMHRLEAARLPAASSAPACSRGNHSSLCADTSAAHLRTSRPRQAQSPASPRSQFLHRLSLCTATARASRKHLVEWIEYHKLLGVEHFYLYDTNPRGTPVKKTLAAVLADYVHSGVLTVVRWPYENCVKGMGSGRVVMVNKPFQAVFMPPRAISQTGALASCYSRYKEFSEWMIHIDDDEFLAFSPTAKFGGVKVQNLYELVSQIASKDPLTNAVSFYPLCVTDCGAFELGGSASGGGRGGGENTTSPKSTVLPRYGSWRKGMFCPHYETKLVMRTAAIGMFFTHYITLREQPPVDASFNHYNREPTPLTRREAAVLHYKDIHNLEESGSIFGATLPVSPMLMDIECKSVPPMKENVTAARVLDSLTKLALPYLERNYISQLTEVYAFEL